MMGIEPDNWYYSPDHGELCRVVETRTLSGDTVCRVWLPGKDTVVRLRATPRQEIVIKLHPRADMRLGKPVSSRSRARGVSPTTVQKVIREARKRPDELRAKPQPALPLLFSRRTTPGLSRP